jgi:hypothetical protein
MLTGRFRGILKPWPRELRRAISAISYAKLTIQSRAMRFYLASPDSDSPETCALFDAA